MVQAIIGGTGIDEMPELRYGQCTKVSTRFGEADIIQCRLDGVDLLFLPRHGLGHTLLPGGINYRAQIAALRKLGVRRVIGVCAVGSLNPDLPAGSLAVLHDFIDLTKRRADTFFDEPGSPVVHTDFSHPYCPQVSRCLSDMCSAQGVAFEPNAVYVGVEGPRYETPAEIQLYQSWGADVIGMTNLPEVVLAREAGLCYGALAVVTNPAAGIAAGPITHDEVRAAFAYACDELAGILRQAVKTIHDPAECMCSSNAGLIL